MSDLPKAWTTSTVGDLADSIQYGHTAKSSKEEVGPRFLRITDIQDNNVDWTSVPFCPIPENQIPKYRLDKGDLLFARTGATVGKSFLIQSEIPESIFASYLIRVRVTKAIESRYLYYFFQSSDYWHQISNSSSGIGQPNVNGKKLAAITLPIAPLPEQRRIVARIEELFSRLDAGVAALHHAKAQLQRYRQSVLAAAVTGQLTQAWREQHPDTESAEELLERALTDARANWSGKRKFVEPAILDPKGLPELPSSWTWTGVEQTGEVKLGRQRSPKQMTGDHIRPYLRVANVYEARIDTSDVNEMNFTPAEFKIYELKYGDILLNEGQSLEWVGRPAMYRDEIEGCCFQNTLVRYRAHKSVLPSYALTVFRSYLHRGRFQKIAKWTNNIAHLGAGRFKEVEFPLPPLAEQHQIVAEVESRTTAIDHLEAELDRQITRSNRLRQSTLAAAFSGKF